MDDVTEWLGTTGVEWLTAYGQMCAVWCALSLMVVGLGEWLSRQPNAVDARHGRVALRWGGKMLVVSPVWPLLVAHVLWKISGTVVDDVKEASRERG